MGFRLRNILKQSVPVHLRIDGEVKEIKIEPKKYYPAEGHLPDTAMTKMAQTLINKKYLQSIKVTEPKPVPKPEPKPEPVPEETEEEKVEEEEKKPVKKPKPAEGKKTAKKVSGKKVKKRAKKIS